MTLPDTPTNFMHSIFPALEGTFIVDPAPGKSRGATLEPVIAWAPDADNPYRAPHPITAHGIRRIIDGAILHPGGMVSDPSVPMSFSNLDEWLQYVASGRPNRARLAATAPDPETPEPRDGASEPPHVEAHDGFTLSDKSFKTNSFWMFFPEGNETPEFVFMVPAGEAIPVATDEIRKITGKERNQWAKEHGCPVYDYTAALKFFGCTADESGGPVDEEPYLDDPEVGGLI